MGTQQLERPRPRDTQSLAIELDRASGKFLLGDTISGRVIAAPWGDARVRQLTVELRWQARSVHDESSATVATAPLVREDSHDPDRREYPFELRIPADTAPSYRGLFGVAWTVTATADIAWARDRHAERIIRIDQRPRARRPIPRDPPAVIRERPGPAPGQPGRTVRNSLAVMVGGAGAAALPWLTGLGGAMVYSLALIGGFATLVTPVHLLETVIRTGRQSVTGALRLIAPRTVRPGEPLFVELQLSPRDATLIERAEYTLTAHDLVTWRGKRSSKNREHAQPIARVIVDAPTRRRDAPTTTGPYRGGGSAIEPPNAPDLGGAALGYGAVIELPTDLPTSFRLSSTSMSFSRSYELDVALHIRGRRDWEVGLTLDVV